MMVAAMFILVNVLDIDTTSLLMDEPNCRRRAIVDAWCSDRR